MELKRLNPSRVDVSNIGLLELHNAMRKFKCDGCCLSEIKENNGPVVLKGGVDQVEFMIIGEAPGAKEDLLGSPFCGPAGELLNELLSSVPDLSDPLISNVVMCRPRALPGSGKENNKPTPDIISSCRPYIKYIINKAKPLVILLMGSTAVESLLPGLHKEKRKMGDLVGGIYFNKDEFPNIVFSIEYHPAFLLRKKDDNLKQLVIKRLKELEEIISELRSSNVRSETE